MLESSADENMKPNDFSDARVLVTGGAGFIGSALVWALNRRGCEHIVVCDRLGTDEKWRNLTPLRFANYVEADELLPRLQNGALGKFNFVFHLGACSSTTERDASYLIRNNYEFTKDLAAWSLANRTRFVYASSAATYGNDYGRYDLIAVLAPHSPTIPLWDSLGNTIAATTNGVDFSDGQIHTVKLVYVPGNLQVYLDDLENPLMTVYVNLAKVMNLDHGRAWVGFTAGTGADWQNHDLISWEFESPGGPAPREVNISTQAETNSPAPYFAPFSPTTPLAPDPSFGYRLPDDTGPAAQIEVSTNLVEWIPLTNAVYYFRDPESTNYPQRFYRFQKN